MRNTVIRAGLAAVVLGGSLAAWGLTTGTASAAAGPIALPESAGIPLPAATVSSPGDMVVDGPRHRVLISDADAGQVVALSYAGVRQAAVDVVGAGTMTMSPDRSRLYVTSSEPTDLAAEPQILGEHEIVVLDVATLTVLERYPLGRARTPTTVVPAGGKLWFSYREVGGYGNWGSIDADGVHVHAASPIDIAQDSLLAVSPTDPDMLAVTGRALTESDLVLYDVSGGVEREIARNSQGDDGISNYSGLTFTADGKQVFLGGYGGKVFRSVPGLVLDGIVNMGGFASVDSTAGAGTMVTDTWGAASLYPPGAVTASQQWNFPLTGRYPYSPRTVAWEPGGARAFVISYNTIGEHLFWELDAPAAAATTLTLTGPATSARGAALALKGTAKGIAGASIAVVRKDLENPAGVRLPAVPVAADGTFTVSDKPAVGGTVAYVVSYAGDALHKPATASAAVAVSRLTPAVTISGNGVVHAFNSTATFTAHLGATYKNRTVEIWADPYGADQPNRLVRKATADSKGNVTASLALRRTTTVSAVFTGDARYAPRTVKAVAATKVSVSTTLVGTYKTGYFRKTVNPRVVTAMSDYPNRKQKLFFESYTGGKWKAWRSAVLPADSTYTLTGTHATGVRYRVRSAYVSGSVAGDSVNYTTYGAFQYFAFTK
ncbi:YncE family protein [Symbioplanes lichenis]|uniref:YncE family protein n=1 Tax=Symbioplanes lichenis TaxID=1629072 RepID=UPI0027398845|nr:hypothetical protein [Actinoplanes lichenis]